MIEKVRNIFIEETTEQLSTLESLLENHSGEQEHNSIVEKVFLVMHSIKGAGPMVGFNTLPTMAIPVEKAFGKIRKGELNVSKELIHKTNSAVRLIIEALQSNSDLHLNDGNDIKELVNFFKNFNS